MKTVKQIEKSLFNENNGIKFSKLKDNLIKHFAKTDREKVIDILLEYSRHGQILHWQGLILIDIIKLVNDNEVNYAGFFEWTVKQPELAYWGVDGLLKTKGRDAFGVIIELVQTDSLAIEVRAKAIKSIAKYSKQPFDRGLAEDPGYWKVEDLRIAELLEWQKQGYNEGVGYLQPQIHSTLKNPKSELEKAVAKLDKKLANKRKTQQDLSNPSNWLAIADSNKMKEIEEKWRLPENYLLFLKYYSPIRVFIDDDRFFQGLCLYGADDLIKNQQGYSINAVTGQVIGDWPTNYIVIADAGADPYCIDIGSYNSNSNDAPIYSSIHGVGKWEFEKYADSFIDFLADIVNK